MQEISESLCVELVKLCQSAEENDLYTRSSAFDEDLYNLCEDAENAFAQEAQNKRVIKNESSPNNIEESESGVKPPIASPCESLFRIQEMLLKNITANQKEILQLNSNIENSISFLTSLNVEFYKKIDSLENKVKEDRKRICLLEAKIEEMQSNKKSDCEIKTEPK
ncbi:hypothetical protein JYU34_015567 [Plutella xylostella]|uniref:Uncharacterized protein n=1 Tax=Plutella xylostella TaxID=51655 RepID=A0ABQ7Q472_PLUXY|nr:hypothetical protein JYU34_015567 [Plutella xylostella]